tara:strand:- start:47916 stop:48245 length:330 start_codon:yes stop_codon:yes gene_type:complete
MKKIFSVVFYTWLLIALVTALYNIVTVFHLVWLGVLLVALAPLCQVLWPYDTGNSMNAKVQLPKVSLLVMIGVAWVLLTLPERGWSLWLVLGGLGGFLLHSYWVMDKSE